MLLDIIVKTSASNNSIEIVNGIYNVNVKSTPHEGKANEDLIGVLSEYFSVPKSNIVIKRGLLSKHKKIDIIKKGV